MDTQHDERTRHCPKLGHQIAFSYCRIPGMETPCSKIYDCWWEAFDITAFMDKNYSEETRKKVTAPPPPKAMSLLDIMKQAQERIQRDEGENK
jgi:hypothetical protein